METARIERERQGVAKDDGGDPARQLFLVKIKNLHDEGAKKELTEIFRFKISADDLMIGDLTDENSHREISIAKTVLKNRGIPFECDHGSE